MGLDMYLRAERDFAIGSAEADAILAAAEVTAAEVAKASVPNEDGYRDNIYIGGWNHAEHAERARYVATLLAAGLPGTPASPSLTVEINEDGRLVVSATVVYWRKANAIHSWFVENCQDGVDECQSTEVNVEALAHLADTCKAALSAYNKGYVEEAGEIMSPTAGFFFGSTDVDEWWATEMRATANNIQAVVGTVLARPGSTKFVYQSSW